MSERNPESLPQGWAIASLPQIATINPSIDRTVNDDSSQVNFVPMRAVAPEGGGLTKPEVRPYGEVKKGYTSFTSGDVIMAKITPCMENGKTAVVPDLPGELCFGSTEFHVIRAEIDIRAKWIANFLLQHEVRRTAQRQMTGGVGQMRVPAAFLDALQIPLAPAAEQQRIIDALDELLTDLDAGVEALQRAKAKLALYRASVLKTALQGGMTAEWRKQNPHAESASSLLQSIFTTRRQRWEEEQLRKFTVNRRTPPANWKSKYKAPVTSDATNLPFLPSGWCWANLGQCFEVHVGATPSRSLKEYWNGEIPWISSGEVRFCRITDTRESITKEGLANTSTQINPIGSVILNMIGEGKTRGKAGLLEIDACNNQNCAAIWVSRTPILPLFIYYWLLYKYEDTRQLGSGNNQPALNSTIVQQITFPLPPLEEQAMIVDLIEDQLSVVNHVEADIEMEFGAARAIWQSVLREAFTGNLLPQDANDEPASKLLKRIAAERAARPKATSHLRKRAKIRKSGQD